MPVEVSIAQTQGRSSKPKLRRQLRGDWVELETADGEVYYANINTKETSWEMPAALAEARATEQNVGSSDKENSTSKAFKSPSAASKLAERDENARTRLAPLGCTYNVSRNNGNTLNESKLLDQSVAALNAMPALSFMCSPGIYGLACWICPAVLCCC